MIDFVIYFIIRAMLVVSIYFLSYTLFEDKLVAYLSVLALLLIRGELG